MSSTSIPRTMQDTPQAPTEQQMNRACEACRLLKVRCLPDSASGSAICQRCQKSGRICIYAAPQKRRQRIRTDTRVAELEREIRAMRSLLTGGVEPIIEGIQGEKGLAAVTVTQDATSIADADMSTTLSYGDEKSLSNGKDPGRQSSIPTSHSTPDEDMSSAGIHPSSMETRHNREFGLLSPDTSNQLFESYNYDLVQHYPAVIFPPNTTPDEIRKSKPVLFQSVVTSASCQLDPVLFRELFKEMVKVYAERIFINGEKSLELIQALILTSVWYCPPDESCGLTNLQFYQYIHIAATMALDLGIGLAVDKSVITLDECRSLLSCYINCAGVALRMRRPNMLQWTSGMRDCLEVLERSPENSLLDKRLATWVKLQNITDDWSGSIGVINPRVELSLKGFERQLQKWEEVAGPGVINISLALAYHQDSIYLHECALEGGSTVLVDCNIKMFQPPPVQEETQSISAAYVNIVMSCINSSHALLDEFLKTDTRTMRVVPIIHYVRASYAIVLLVKLFISASAPSNELGKILDRQLLKVDYYIEALLEKHVAAAGPAKLKVPTKWLIITQQVGDWYHKYLMAFDRGQQQANKGSEASEVAFRATAFRDSNSPNTQPSWKIGSFTPTASLQDHALLRMRSDEPSSQLSYNSGTLIQNREWPNIPKPPITNNDRTTYAPSTNEPSVADFASMNFTQDNLSSLDLPSVSPRVFNASWMPNDEGMLAADMDYESGFGGWGWEG